MPVDLTPVRGTASGAASLPTALLLGALAIGSQTMPWPYTLTREPYERLGNRGYAPAVFDMLEREHEASQLGPMASVVPDLLATQLVFVGEHQPASERDAQFRDLIDAKQPEAEVAFEGFEARAAVQAVLELAGDRRVVMFNEEHRSARQRAFMHALLGGLRDAGFTHLACETLVEDDALEQRGYPTMASGPYARDPVYGELLRRAVELGFQLARYEITPAQRAAGDAAQDPLAAANRREAAQAENLAALLEEQDVRVVVFAGRHHISEGTSADWTPMGALLAASTGLDPLSVDLMLMEPRLRPEHEHPARRAALTDGLLADEPVVLLDPLGRPYSPMPDSLDLVVFLPNSADTAGRPDWLDLGGLRRQVFADVPTEPTPALLQALRSGEDEQHAVPADQLVVHPDAEPRPLWLRGGSYTLRLLDPHGDVVWRGRHEVMASSPARDRPASGRDSR